MLKKQSKMMKDNKIKFLKNGWLLFKLSVFFTVLTGCKTYAQIENSNEDAIDNIKSTASKNFIEKNLVGYWEFEKLTTSSNETISERELKIDTLKMVEKVSRPDVVFYKNNHYEVISNENNVLKEKGTWSYDENEKILKFVFDEPQYSVPIDKISPELLKQLTENGSLIKLTENYWEINRITADKLSIIEHLPHNEFELKYDLRVYKKRE